MSNTTNPADTRTRGEYLDPVRQQQEGTTAARAKDESPNTVRCLTCHCPTCPFLREEIPGSVRMSVDQVQAVVERLFSPKNGFWCHSTVEILPDGTLDTTHAAPCAGALMFVEKAAASEPALRVLADRTPRAEGYDPSRPRGWDRVFSSVRELFAAALPKARHRPYLHTGNGELRPLVIRVDLKQPMTHRCAWRMSS